MVVFKVQPGIISVVVFVLFDLVGLPCLENTLRIILNIFYYRRIFRAHPVLVKNANFPGITEHLLGRRFDGINLCASAMKIVLLVVILLVDIHITSRSAFVETPRVRMGTFVLNPSDEARTRNVVFTVQRRYEHSRECVIQSGDELTYYRIAFHLKDGILLDDDLGVSGINVTGQYDIDDSTIICLAPDKVKEPAPLSRVTGCSRVEPGQCTVFYAETKPATFEFIEEDLNIPGFSRVVYDPKAVARVWEEYENPLLTCVSTWVSRSLNILPFRKLECLLVVRNGTHTIVENWAIVQEDNGSFVFFLAFPGVVFEGDLAIEEDASVDVLRTIDIGKRRPLTWKALSAQLISRSSDFVGNGTVELGRLRTITEMPLWAIVLGGASVGCVVLIGIVVGLTARADKRPKLNTTSGLSSMLREEHMRTGSSMKQGDAALVGLAWSDEKKSSLRLRVVSSGKECHPRDEGIDIA